MQKMLQHTAGTVRTAGMLRVSSQGDLHGTNSLLSSPIAGLVPLQAQVCDKKTAPPSSLISFVFHTPAYRPEPDFLHFS